MHTGNPEGQNKDGSTPGLATGAGDGSPEEGVPGEGALQTKLSPWPGSAREGFPKTF